MMSKEAKFKEAIRTGIVLLTTVGFCLSSSAQDVNLKVHLTGGIYSTKITLMPLTGNNAFKPLIEKPDVKLGEAAVLQVPKDKLPGEFVLRFDYKDKESGNPYPSEKRLFISDQDLELWANPKYANNSDSTWFQKDERENNLYVKFSKENATKREQIGLLQNFLMGYDQPHSEFYQSAVREYENRREQYNRWINSQINEHKNAFVSNVFPFQCFAKIEWKGTEEDRMKSLITHYFDEIDFQNPLLIKTAQFKDWMDQYVNLYGAMAKTIALRDSLFSLAGKRAIEKAKTGHPLLYGWMVDYFYKGYEGFNIASGIKMLEPYLDDPRCLTSKRLEIEKRLQGIETIRPGTIAPDFATTDNAGHAIQFLNYKTNAKYKLVLFWSADCQHCKELMPKLYQVYQQAGGKSAMEVFAISVDFTDTEIKAWDEAKPSLQGWKHSRAKGGINSPEASAYYILATPVMILVDAKTNKIAALPDSADDLAKVLK